jgi:CheY-like chemotaxis protein
MVNPPRDDAARSLLEQLRDALDHLYDHVALEQHPLQQALGLNSRSPSRGRALQQHLTGAIAALCPGDDVPSHAAAWRVYRLLTLRYVEGQTSAQVAGQLGIGERQLRRDHTQALAALARSLRPDMAVDEAEPAEEAAAEDDDLVRIGKAPRGNGADLAATIEGVRLVVARLAAQRQVSLTIDLSAGSPSVLINPVALRQALISTLSCLIDHSAAVRLSVSRRGGAAVLQLLAAGGGPLVASEERLQVGRQLIAMQGGSVSFTPAPDGIGVTIELPARPSVTLLVIDDNPDIVRLFQRYIAPIGGRVAGATTAEEALRLARELPPQVIVLDVMMPMQDGWEILQLFRNRPETRALPIIVCSVLKERDLALSLGADSFLPKPVSQAALLAAIEPWQRATP